MAERDRRRYFTAPRREQYLANLRRTGNHSAAAREAGVSERAVRRFRARTPDYEALCAAAVREAQRRLGGMAGDGTESAFESIRRGADGRLKIQAQGSRRWSRRAEDRFFAVLRESGNIAASARAAGVSREAVWKRRRTWPAFARRFGEAMEEAEIALEFRVLCLGSNWTEAAEEGGAAAEEACDAAAREAAARFDPELALRFLKWRTDRKGSRPASAAALPSAEEVRERILRKVAAIRRYEEREAAREAEDNE
jgi:molybdenum-dependent DNA-binding transcriptional regulator ModE